MTFVKIFILWNIFIAEFYLCRKAEDIINLNVNRNEESVKLTHYSSKEDMRKVFWPENRNVQDRPSSFSSCGKYIVR